MKIDYYLNPFSFKPNIRQIMIYSLWDQRVTDQYHISPHAAQKVSPPGDSDGFHAWMHSNFYKLHISMPAIKLSLVKRTSVTVHVPCTCSQQSGE